MVSKEGESLTPEFEQAREEYRTNLRVAFGQFGFSGAVLDEITAVGCTPALEYESSDPGDFLNRDLNQFFFKELHMRPWTTDGAGIRHAVLSFDYLNLQVNALKHFDVFGNKSVNIVELPSTLSFDLKSGVYIPKYGGTQPGQNDFIIRVNIMQHLARLPQTIAEFKETVAVSFR